MAKRWYAMAPALLMLFAAPGIAVADVFPLDEFSVTRSNTQIFDDSYNRNVTLVGAPTSRPSGTSFLDTGTSANYFVGGTIPETTANNGQALLSPANGLIRIQPDPFIPVIQDVFATLQTGTTTETHVLTPTTQFTVVGLFDLQVPSVVLGTYDIQLTNNTPSAPGIHLQARVRDCQTGVGLCRSHTGPALQFVWLNYVNNTATGIAVVPITPADLLNHPQLELELVHGSTSSDVISAFYGFGSGNTLATFNGSLTLLGTTTTSTDLFTPSLQFALAGVDAFQPIPEPASLLLLGAGVAGLAGLSWRRHRRT